METEENPMANDSKFTTPYLYKSSMNATIKDVDENNGIVTGYYAAFGNIDHHFDKILKGAFKRSIKNNGPKGSNQIMHLLQHDARIPLGKPTVLKEDDTGLYFETKFADTTAAKDALALYDAGVYNEHSIGYRVMKWKRVDDANGNFDHYELHELKLFEGSTVTWGANDQTPFTGFKEFIGGVSTKEDAYALLDKRVDNVMKGLKIGSLSDETLQTLEIQLRQLTTAYKEVDSLILNNQRPDLSTDDNSDHSNDSNKLTFKHLTKINL